MRKQVVNHLLERQGWSPPSMRLTRPPEPSSFYGCESRLEGTHGGARKGVKNLKEEEKKEG